jgi:hypothetical protein
MMLTSQQTQNQRTGIEPRNRSSHLWSIDFQQDFNVEGESFQCSGKTEYLHAR